MSLNPIKCLFAVSEGKLLGHIVRNNGIYIDLDMIRALNELKPHMNHKGVQSFFAKINFARRFIPYYASIANPINKLLKKDQYF